MHEDNLKCPDRRLEVALHSLVVWLCPLFLQLEVTLKCHDFVLGPSGCRLTTAFTRGHAALQEHEVKAYGSPAPRREVAFLQQRQRSLLSQLFSSSSAIPVTKQDSSFLVLSQRTHLGYLAELKNLFQDMSESLHTCSSLQQIFQNKV